MGSEINELKLQLAEARAEIAEARADIAELTSAVEQLAGLSESIDGLVKTWNAATGTLWLAKIIGTAIIAIGGTLFGINQIKDFVNK